MAFNTVFQACLTPFLVDSGYKPPIRSMDELLGSGMKLAYDPIVSVFYENGDESEASNVRRNEANCPSFDVCMKWAKYHKNVSVYLSDNEFETVSRNGGFSGENGEPLLCRIDDGVIFNLRSVMLMFYGEPLLKRINDAFDRVVEAGLYNYWFSLFVEVYKIGYYKIPIFNPLDEYYSFNLYHMQPAFYLLLIGLCLSAFCFVIEVFCYCLFKRS
jgi:hypothetical protein